jgi:hypothetical protein
MLGAGGVGGLGSNEDLPIQSANMFNFSLIWTHMTNYNSF